MAVMVPAAPQTPTSPFPSQNTVQPSSLSRLTLSDKLLLSQAVHHIGTSPPDWGRVSSILLSHPLIKTKSRLEQAAKAGITLGRVFGSRECERAWVALMRQYNLVLQPGERDTSIESEPEAGSPALANRSKEARGLPAKTDRGSQLALAQFLYAERIRELQDTIKAKETAFKTIVSEIEALNSGSLDDKLLAELEKSGQLREEAAAAETDAAHETVKDFSMGDMTPTPSQSTPGKSTAVSRAASVSSVPDVSPSKTAVRKDAADGASSAKAADVPVAKSAEQTAEKAETPKATSTLPETSESVVASSGAESQAAAAEKRETGTGKLTDKVESTHTDAVASSEATSQPVEALKDRQSTVTTATEETAEAKLLEGSQVDPEADEQASGEDRTTSAASSSLQGKRKRAKDGADSGAEENDQDVAVAAKKKQKSDEEPPTDIAKDAPTQETFESAEKQAGHAAAAAETAVVDSDNEVDVNVNVDEAMHNAEQTAERAEDDVSHGDAKMDIDETEEDSAQEGSKEQPESSEEAEEDADVESKASKRPEPRRSRRSGKVPTVGDEDAATPGGSAIGHAGTSANGAKNNRVEALRSREASGASAETDEERALDRDNEGDGEVDTSHSNVERSSRTSLSPASARRSRARPRRSGRGGSVGGGGTVDDGATGSDTERERAAQVAKQRKMEKVLLMLLNEVSNHTHGNLFHAPIKETDAPDYYTLIRHPVDLKTIKARIKDGRITTATQLRRALMQMFANSLIYNRPGSEIHRMALEMRDAAEEMLDRFEQTQMSANASRR